MLFIWAKENPEFKYQQGMNEILAIVLICLVSEIVNEQFLDDLGIDLYADDADENLIETCQLFAELHNPEHIWADAYTLFENIMNLGVKDYYYKESDSASPHKHAQVTYFRSDESATSSMGFSFKSTDS